MRSLLSVLVLCAAVYSTVSYPSDSSIQPVGLSDDDRNPIFLVEADGGRGGAIPAVAMMETSEEDETKESTELTGDAAGKESTARPKRGILLAKAALLKLGLLKAGVVGVGAAKVVGLGLAAGAIAGGGRGYGGGGYGGYGGGYGGYGGGYGGYGGHGGYGGYGPPYRPYYSYSSHGYY